MSKDEAENKPKPIKYQIYLGGELQESVERYMKENFPPDSRVKTIVFREALMDLMKKKGYYDVHDEEVMPLTNTTNKDC